MTYSTFQTCKQIPSNKQGTLFCENCCQGITNILYHPNAQQYISPVYTTLRCHRNCPDRRHVTVPPHWHIWSLCTFSLYFLSVLNIIPNWTWPQISIERRMGSVCIISERAQSSGRCRGCPHCWEASPVYGGVQVFPKTRREAAFPSSHSQALFLSLPPPVGLL